MRSNAAAYLVLAGTALMALSGCEQVPPSDPDPTLTPTKMPDRDGAPTKAEWPRPIPAGTELWFVTAENAVGKFSLPDEPYGEAERLRERAGADPVIYTTVTVDNRNGKAGVNMHELTAYDAEGRKYSFKTVDHFMDEWGQKERAHGTLTHNPLAAARNEHEVFANVGEVKEFVMAMEDTDLPEEFIRVSVRPHDNAKKVQAYPPADSEYVNLDFEAPQ